MNTEALIYVTDQRGYNLTLLSLASYILTQNNDRDIYVFCHNFEPENTKNLQNRSEDKGFRVNFVSVNNSSFNDIKIKGHITNTTYLKLHCVLDLKDKYDKVLYSDNDILYVREIDLSNVNFKNTPLAAVIDVADSSGMTDEYFIETCKKNNVSSRYFNAGLLYFNCIKLRTESSLIKDFHNHVNTHKESCWYKETCRTNDQCSMNFLFSEKWVPLPLTNNMQACLKYSDLWTQASVRHYQGKTKFYPITSWREDRQAISLINRTLDFMDMDGQYTSGITGNIFYFFNKLRQYKSIKNKTSSLKYIDKVHGSEFVK